MKNDILVFSLGPVQSFIAESRRTADGWMGSYLLSVLVGNALKTVRPPHTIIEPGPGATMLQAIASGRFAPDDDPAIATLPNTVLIQVGDGEANDLGLRLREEVHSHWDKIVERIAANGLAAASMLPSVSEQWKDQTAFSRHWETYWAWASDEAQAFRRLAARKALRDFQPWEESGDRCTMCGVRMPLVDPSVMRQSPTVQAAARASWAGWSAALNGLPRAPGTLIRTGGSERLCSICLLKRLLPWSSNPVKDLWQGFEAVGSFPSTSTMCTVQFRVDLLKAASDPVNGILLKRFLEYEKAVKDADESDGRGLVEATTALRTFDVWSDCVKDQVLHKTFNASGERLSRLLRLDGDFYLYERSVANERGFESRHDVVARAYKALINEAGKCKVQPPPIYWGMLALDGDHMGEFLRRAQQENIDTTQISAAISAFSVTAVRVIRAHHGRAIFAGGDDVLAMLPFKNALSAANALRKAFKVEFQRWKAAWAPDRTLEIPTVSAALVLAHHQAPLSRVILESQRLLKTWAKGRAGRNAIAIQRFMRGGPAETFAAKWEHGGVDFCDTLQGLSEAVTLDQLGSRSLYNVRRYAWLLDPQSWNLPDVDRQAVVNSMLGKSRLSDGANVEGLTAQILRLGDAAAVANTNMRFVIEPLTIARFLSTGGRA